MTDGGDGVQLEMTDVQVDVQAHLSAVRGGEFWQFAAERWHEAYAPYVPWDTGALYGNVEIAPGEIVHTAPYAQAVYEGDFDFRKDVHPFATGRWDLAAAETRLPLVVAAMQAYVDEGRLRIGESDDS